MSPVPLRRGGREAEGGGLLNRYTLSRRIVGLNPISSAISLKTPIIFSFSGTVAAEFPAKSDLFGIFWTILDKSPPAFARVLELAAAMAKSGGGDAAGIKRAT